MYILNLTDGEVKTLGWLADRGYWSQEAYDNMHLVDGEPEEVDGDTERKWEIEEHAAWDILTCKDEDLDAYLTCCGQPLLRKLVGLEVSIV